MKLTKRKLEQLILQEMKSYVQVAGERGMRTNPKYQDKLLDIYKSDPTQGISLADAIDEPIYAPIDDKEDFEDFLPAGIRQFEQNSYVSFDEIPFGFIEFFYNTDSKEFIVAYYKGPSSTGGFEFVPKLSKEFSNSKEAIEYYNKFADVPYKKSEPLKKRGEGFKL